MCCGDPATIQRHVVANAHTLSTSELETVIVRRYLMPHEEAHRKSGRHADHVRSLVAKFGQNPQGPDLTECDNCK